jgi:hypothetical protein
VRRRGTLVAIGVLAALALAGGQAHAAVSCGKVVEQDLKLKKDLKNCPGDGLVAGAADIKINLNGHKVDGQGTGTGIEVSGYTHVVVKGGGGGKVKQFEHAVALLNGNSSRVKGLTIKDTTNEAIVVNSCDDAHVRRNTISGSAAYSVSVAHAEDIEIQENDITVPAPDLVTTAAFAINAGDTVNVLVEDNVVHGGHEATWGILVNGTAQATTIQGNKFRGFTQYGIGVYDNADDSVVKDNDVARNAGDGIFVQSTVGTGTAVIGNRSHDNGGDGIDIDASAVEVGGNEANNNTGFGIVAVPGVTDLGGNEASGNGAGQCSGVACS